MKECENMKRKVMFNEGIFEEFLNNHDMVYTSAPANWEKGIPMGNSKISAVTWGDDKLKVTINRADIWEMRRFQPEEDLFTWNYFTKKLEDKTENMKGILQTNEDFGPVPQQLPLGRFEVITKGKEILDYKMRLHLYDAYSSGYISTNVGSYKWDCHVSATQPIIVFNYEVFGNEELDFYFRFTSKSDEFKVEGASDQHTHRFKGLNRGYNRKKLPEVSRILRDWGYKEPEFYSEEDIHVYKQEIPENGNYSVAYKTISVSGQKKSLIVAITCDSDYGKAELEAINLVKKYSITESLDLELCEHKRWWHEFYPASFFTLNDTKLESLYWINLYKLGCVSRKDGQATPMSGLWIPDDTLAPWGNTYIWNTQQEMPFFGTYVGNRLDTQLTTYQLLIDHRDEMRHIGENFFGVKDGEYLVHLTDYKLGCPNYSKDHFQAVSGPWMMQMMWNYYKFSLDIDFLREHVYSMMKAQCKVLMAILQEGEDGKLHFPWSMSAEYPPMGGHLSKTMKRFGTDATSDLSYTIWICETLLEAMQILGIDDIEKQKWEYVLKNIAPYTYDEFGGLMVRSDMPLSDSHRHLSHLFPITQTHQITAETPEGRKIIERSLHALKVSGTGEWMGWTFSETSKIAHQLGDSPLAYTMIREYADKIVNENSMDFNSSRDNNAFTYHVGLGLTIDSDGMFNEALQNFAVTSFNNTSYFFTCVPKELKDISFYHFRTEGAFLVSGERKNGKTSFISIEPEFGGVFCFVSDLGTNIDIYCDEEKVAYNSNGNRIVLDTEKGKEYIVTAKGNILEKVVIKAVEPKQHEVNYFGCKL